MKKNILIGCIVAVVILVIVPFTSVVGFQNIKSNSTINSPLFSIRTKRATNEESRDFTCDFVGKNKDTTIPFPTYNSRNTLLQRDIDIIRQMNDKTFEKFVDLITNKLRQRDVVKTLGLLYQLRDDKNQLSNLESGETDEILPVKPTANGCVVPSINQWSPFCIILNILGLFLQYISVIIYLIKEAICNMGIGNTYN